MAQLDDLSAAVAAEGTELENLRAAFDAEVTRVEKVIQDLKDLGGANATVAQAITDLQAHTVKLQALETALANVEPTVPTPTSATPV